MIANGIQWLVSVFGRQRAPDVLAAYRTCLDPEAPASRLVLRDLAAYCRVGQSSFVAGDPYQTAFNEGARDAFLHICEMTGLDPFEAAQRLTREISNG